MAGTEIVTLPSLKAPLARDLPPASPAYRPLASRSTSGSWLVSFARRGSSRPQYWLKVRKAVRTHPPSRRKAEQLSPDLEYKTAVSLYEYFANFPEFAGSIPRPVQFLPNCEGIVMDYREGRHLKDAVFSSGNALGAALRPGGLHDIAATCGSWLRRLHDMTPPDWLPAHPFEASQLAGRTSEAASSLRPEVARHIPFGKLGGWIDELRPEESGLAVSHGDFQPGNILVSGPRISVVDVGTAGVRARQDDIGFFITFAFTQKQRVAFGNAAGTRAFVRGFCDSFLRGYGFQSPQGRAGLRPFIAWLIVQRLADMNARIERWRPVPRFVLRARLVSWVRSELPLFLQEFE